MIDESLMSFEEKYTYKLRSVYTKYGYQPYKMGKFEEYELYIRNKDFLVSDRVIAFNDTNGKLMALKPDVTLSIIKSGEDIPGVKQKVFYNENVYRVSESTHRFREIMQMGLECIGDVDIYDIYETVFLAAESLAGVSEDFCIDLSNLDILREAIFSVCPDEKFVSEAIACVGEKNSHDLRELCVRYGVGEEGQKNAEALITLYGDRKTVIAGLKERFSLPGTERLEILSRLLDLCPHADKIRFDFSVVNDMNYYNGFVFKGFVKGICSGVLTGGQYDGMMKKMNRLSGAVGFAIYLDRLEELNREKDKTAVDYLLLYDETTNPLTIAEAAGRYTASGATVTAQKSIPDKLRYRNIADYRNKG